TIGEVLARLESIQGGLPRTDGIACFTRFYSAVGEGVRAELAGTTLAAPRFVERLEVVFADAVFAALEAHQRDPATAPRAWAPLSQDRSHRGVLPLQFALAGMNAHVNGDLPVALVTTCGELGLELRCGSPEHEDYQRVSAVLARVEEQVCAEYLTGPVGL